MRYNFSFCPELCLLALIFFSCANSPETNAQVVGPEAGPVVSPEALLDDFKGWWSYHYEQVDLTTDFIARDVNGKTIGKEQFLSQLTTGTFYTVEQQSAGGQDSYRLYPFVAADHPAMSATLKSVAALDLKRFRMEGLKIPDFSVVDLSGETIATESLMGKYTIIKTWFIACKPCIAEFPELNELVASYRERNDLQFVSLALDKKDALTDFLTRMPFSYRVVPSQKAFIEKDLHLVTYPTHIVVGPDGTILKVVGKVKQLKNFLETL